MDEIPSKFSNTTEEIEFWKSKYQEKVTELEDLEQQFAEFQDTSKEVEKELEVEFQRAEKKSKDTNAQYQRLKIDFEEALEKSRKNNEENSRIIRNLETQIETLKKHQDQWSKDKQRLEQDNDDLERKEREAGATAADLTEKLNKLLEDNAWLQTELEEQQSKTKESSQRMKDEIRDLRLEISLFGMQSKVPPSAKQESSENITPTPPPSARETTAVTSNDPTAINLVDEMLQLVKNMEKKFTTKMPSSAQLRGASATQVEANTIATPVS